MTARPLTAPQRQALAKLTNQWQSSYNLGVPRGTLNTLVERGLAELFYDRGAMFDPATGILYRLKVGPS